MKEEHGVSFSSPLIMAYASCIIHGEPDSTLKCAKAVQHFQEIRLGFCSLPILEAPSYMALFTLAASGSLLAVIT